MRVIILTNDRKTRPKRIRASNLTFNHGNRSYTIEPREIYITQYLDQPKKKGKPISFYFENNPQPLGFVDPEEFKDRSGAYLEKAIAINAVKQQSSQSIGKNLISTLEAVGSYVTLGNIFLLIVGISLIYAYLRGEFI